MAERVAQYCQHCGAEIILAAHERTGQPFALNAEPVPFWGTHELLDRAEQGHQMVGGMWRCRPLPAVRRATKRRLFQPHSETCSKKGRR